MPELSRAPLTPRELIRVGLNDTAYVKTVKVEGQTFFAVHAADGTPLTVAKARDLAFATVRQNNMEPVSVH